MKKKTDTLTNVCIKILRKITPKRTEKKETLQFSSKISKNLNEKLLSSGIVAKVQIQGSIAKDTWLAGEKDIDIFILLSKKNTREIFTKVLDIVKSFVGTNWTEAYAEHPYVKAQIDNYKIDFIPCFKIEKVNEKASSVDRTPLHTSYVKDHLNHEIKNEIRLFKQFLHGIGIYGAEIKVKGFSGYLCEILILYYGSFVKTLQGMATYRFGQLIDIENYYKERIEQAKLAFDAPLIVIDPVDADRNVAAAVSEDRLGELIMASKLFLTEPDVSYFYPKKTEPLSTQAFENKLRYIGFDLVFVVFKNSENIPDILWGQLYKTSQALKGVMVQNDFQVIRNVVWSDEKEINIIVFILGSNTISSIKRHPGPPIDSREATKFIEKYLGNDRAVMGPWTEYGKWITVAKRRHTNAVSLLKEKVQSEDSGIAHGLMENAKESKVYVNQEILDLYSTNNDFARFLTETIIGRPIWMK